MTRTTTILAAALVAAAAPALAQSPMDQILFGGKPLDAELHAAGVEALRAAVKPAPQPNVTWQDLEGIQRWLRPDHKMKVTHGPIDRRIVPPAAFDGPYKGNLQVTIVESEADVMKQCPVTSYPAKLGCAHRRGQIGPDGPFAECHIVIANEATTESWGFTLATIYRHELAHCNGWPGDHKGARLHSAPAAQSQGQPAAEAAYDIEAIRAATAKAQAEGKPQAPDLSWLTQPPEVAAQPAQGGQQQAPAQPAQAQQHPPLPEGWLKLPPEQPAMTPDQVRAQAEAAVQQRAGAEVPAQYRGLWCEVTERPTSKTSSITYYRCREATSEGYRHIRRDLINLSEEGDCHITAVTPTTKGHRLRAYCPSDVSPPDPPEHVNLRLDARGRLHLD